MDKEELKRKLMQRKSVPEDLTQQIEEALEASKKRDLKIEEDFGSFEKEFQRRAIQKRRL